MFFSCSKEKTETSQEINLKYELENNYSKNSELQNNEIIINATVIYVDGEPKLISDELLEVDVVDNSNDILAYGYVLRENIENPASNSANKVPDPQCTFSQTRGYFFDGECFVYGTFTVGTNCVTNFNGCGMSCVGFDDVCPGYNEGYALNL